ncbi:MAG: GDSL-type esterase/lipase family protein [Spirochaetota bacterium]
MKKHRFLFQSLLSLCAAAGQILAQAPVTSYENIAQKKPHVSSDPNPSVGRGFYSFLTDGDLSTDDKTSTYATGNAAQFPKTVTIDLEGSYYVDRIKVYNSKQGGTKTVTVAVSPDNAEFTTIGEKEFANYSQEIFELGTLNKSNIRYVRIIFKDRHAIGFMNKSDLNYVFLRKVEVYGARAREASMQQTGNSSFLPSDDTRLFYSDYARKSIVDTPAGRAVRFDRIIDPGGKGYQWDNPGTRLRFKTDAASVSVHLYYNEKHVSTSARNPIGRYSIDGKSDSSWRFTSAQTSTVRKPETVIVPITPPSSGMHEYTIVLPYGDSVDVLGITVPDNARFETPAPRPTKRLIAYGDSVTHGFTASEVTKSYIFRFANRMDWQLVNMGIGGRSASPNEGAFIASQNGDVISILIGVNDWQGGRAIASFKSNYEGFLKNLRGVQPNVPLIIITPLWVPASWKPATATIELEEYRRTIREIVAALGDANIKLIDGPSLIDHEDGFFDKVGVHPNDDGFAQMAERLAEAVRQ